MLSFSGAIDALRIANRIQPNSYSWMLTSETGNPVYCSANISYNVDSKFMELWREDTIVICGGIDIQQSTTKRLLNWVRREARKGVNIIALCTATYTLAKAGLLDGKKATIHWENQDSFSEEFQENDINLTKTVFVVDGNRMTTAGGTSSIDLMLQVIATDLGEEKANYVADQMIYSSIRTNEDQQRLSIPTRIGVRHPKLSKVIQTMELHLEDPISPSDLAVGVGMSTRQLERLFRRYLNRSPKRYYMELRLQKARNLLMQTDMSHHLLQQ